jgi:hypothetical protein
MKNLKAENGNKIKKNEENKYEEEEEEITKMDVEGNEERRRIKRKIGKR